MINKNFVLSAASAIALIFAASAASAQEAVTTDIDWSKGAPRFTSSDGNFQFKIRGRFMMDAYAQESDFAGTDRDISNSGFATRRARLGVEGTFNRVFKYKAEYTFRTASSGNVSEFNDVFVSWDPGNGWEALVGNNYVTSSMDGYTSSVDHLTNERGLATNAFGQASRSLGFVVRKYSDNWMVVGGLYGDDGSNPESSITGGTSATSPTAVTTEGRYGQIRGDWAISNARGNYLVVGAHVRLRDANGSTGSSSSISYSARPAQTNYSASNYLQGAPEAVRKDVTYGVEGLWTHGSLSVFGEYQFVNAESPNRDYDLNGGMLEVSYFLTGETRGYNVKEGKLTGIKPNSPLADGGFGAWGLVARYDHLDLSDFNSSVTAGVGIEGTEANAISVGVFWQPSDYVIVRGMYGYTEYDRSSVTANSTARVDGTVNAFTLRTQFSF